MRGLTKLGIEINPPHLGDWPFRLGQFLLNASAIELLTYQYLNILEAERDDFNKNLGQPLTARINRIRKLVSESQVFPDALKAEIDGLWSEAGEFTYWRNRIAHNPVLPTWKTSDPDKDPPDLMGIPDMKQLEVAILPIRFRSRG